MAAPSYSGQQPPLPPQNPSMMGTHGPMPQQMPNVPPELPDVMSATLLCKWGQDIIQEISTRTAEVFGLMKAVVPLNTPYANQNLRDKKDKIGEHMKVISIMFRNLKMVYDKVMEKSAPFEYITVDSLIPYKEGPESGTGRTMIHENKSLDENLVTKRNQLAATLRAKNEHIKMIIDQMRNLCFDINTMLSMRKP